MSKVKLVGWIKDNWVLPLALAISAALQFSFISKSSIWHDEGYSLWLIKYDYLEILARTARDVHPPLYYLFLKGWTSVFGTSEIAARSFSTLCILGVITLVYLLLKKTIGKGSAQASALLLAFAPFLIRYGQEARMYALVALFLTAATYVLVTALDSNSKKLLFVYSLLMALSFYVHYYAVFMVLVHWLYVAFRTQYVKKRRLKGQLDLLSPWWWLANATIVALFAPWLPSAVNQFTRVQGGFWIPPVNINTILNTVSTYLQYLPAHDLPLWLQILALSMFGIIIIWTIVANKNQRSSVLLFSLWAFLPPSAVFVISVVARPVYIDRYFVFASIGFYVLLATLLYLKPVNFFYKVRPLIIVLFISLFCYGIRNIYLQSNHMMSMVGDRVSSNYSRGDVVISGELYTLLDYNYYKGDNQRLYLYAPDGVSGYGETSLFYDQPELLLSSFKGINANRVWLVGKTGDKDYYNQIPDDWKLLETYSAKDSMVKLYQLP